MARPIRVGQRGRRRHAKRQGAATRHRRWGRPPALRDQTARVDMSAPPQSGRLKVMPAWTTAALQIRTAVVRCSQPRLAQGADSVPNISRLALRRAHPPPLLRCSHQPRIIGPPRGGRQRGRHPGRQARRRPPVAQPPPTGQAAFGSVPVVTRRFRAGLVSRALQWLDGASSDVATSGDGPGDTEGHPTYHEHADEHLTANDMSPSSLLEASFRKATSAMSAGRVVDPELGACRVALGLAWARIPPCPGARPMPQRGPHLSMPDA